MAGTVYSYLEGYLRVAFRPSNYGDFLIDLQVSADGVIETAVADDWAKGAASTRLADDLHVMMATSPSESWFFTDMVRWLEAVIGGVQECAFRWENEGPEGSLRWFNNRDGRGRLHVRWSGSRKDPSEVDGRFLLNQEQVVRAFYEGMRSISASPSYSRLDYEPVTVGECVGLILDGEDQEKFPAVLSAMDDKAGTRLVEALLQHAYDGRLGFPRFTTLSALVEAASSAASTTPGTNPADVARWLGTEWDQLSVEARKREVVDQMYGFQAWYSPGERLSELRSERVEAWIAKQQVPGA